MSVSPQGGSSHAGMTRRFEGSKAARHGPVIVTDRGRPAHVLLSYEEYQRLVAGGASIIDLLGAPEGVEDVDLELPVLGDRARAARLR
jgi:hypothetical protein